VLRQLRTRVLECSSDHRERSGDQLRDLPVHVRAYDREGGLDSSAKPQLLVSLGDVAMDCAQNVIQELSASS